MIRTIILALDGSATAERALPYVTLLARAFDAKVVLLRVVEGRGGGRSPWTDPVEWRLERSEAMAYLRVVEERLDREGIDTDLDVGVGQPSEEILETARARGAALIALTTHGRGGATAVPLAGTAHKVITGTETSILLVPATGEGEPPEPRRVLVGLDGSPRSEWALYLATTLAREAAVPMVLVHVVPRPEVLRFSDVERIHALCGELMEANQRAGERYLAGALARLEASDLRLATRTVRATTSVPRALSELAAEEPGTLLALSARGASSVSGCTYGSVARAMVEEGAHPLLVLRDAAPRESAPGSSPPGARRTRNPKDVTPA